MHETSDEERKSAFMGKGERWHGDSPRHTIRWLETRFAQHRSILTHVKHSFVPSSCVESVAILRRPSPQEVRRALCKEMEKQFLLEFIETYRQHPALWKIKCKDYVNKNIKNAGYAALVEVCNKFNFKADRDTVAKKIQSLRSTFRKEYKKVERSLARGDEDIYTPNLWYYELLLFTKDQDVSCDNLRMSASNLQSIILDGGESNGGDEEDFPEYFTMDDLRIETQMDADNANLQLETQALSSPTAFNSLAVTSFDIDQPRSLVKKRKKDATPPDSSAIPDSNPEDDTDVFGAYVAKKLKNLKSDSQKMLAETLITQILQKASVNRLTESVVKTLSAMGDTDHPAESDAEDDADSIISIQSDDSKAAPKTTAVVPATNNNTAVEDGVKAPKSKIKKVKVSRKSLTRQAVGCLIEFVNQKKTSVLQHDNADLEFQKSLLPDIAKMDDYQKRQLKRRTLEVIDSILCDGPKRRSSTKNSVG